MSIQMDWTPKSNAEVEYLCECCRKVYDKLDPDFKGPYGRKCIKLDGSICEKHQAIEDGIANK